MKRERERERESERKKKTVFWVKGHKIGKKIWQKVRQRKLAPNTKSRSLYQKVCIKKLISQSSYKKILWKSLYYKVCLEKFILKKVYIKVYKNLL